MRRYHIESFVNVQKLTAARRAIVLERMRHILGSMPDPGPTPGHDRLRIQIEEALKLQREALALIRARRGSREDVMHAQGAKELDAKLDKVLSMLYANLSTLVELFEGEKAQLAQKVREAVFKDGVASITSRPFVEQHELVKLLVHDLRTGELAAAVSALGLQGWVERLQQLNTAYGQHLTRPARVDAERVSSADARAWVALVEVVTSVILLHPSNSEVDIAGRHRLLGPLIEQEQEAALLRSRRRSPVPEEALLEEEAPVEGAEVAISG
jgi:hypothetical protein